MRRPLVLLAALLLACLALTSCSGGSDSSGGSGGSGGGTTVDITIKGTTITPNGDRVKATGGTPVTLHIDSDRKGELHVHSTPEQEIAFPKGRSTRRLTIDKPGIVDVEDHALESVVVQL